MAITLTLKDFSYTDQPISITSNGETVGTGTFRVAAALGVSRYSGAIETFAKTFTFAHAAWGPVTDTAYIPIIPAVGTQDTQAGFDYESSYPTILSINTGIL